MSKKEKTFSEMMKNPEPNTSVKLTASDRAKQWMAMQDTIDKKRKEHVNFWFLFLGLLFGIFGSYVSTQIYDFSRNILLVNKGFEEYFLFNILIWIIFGIIVSIFVVKLRRNNLEIKDLREMQEKWSNAKSIEIGEIWTPEDLEKLNKFAKEKLKEQKIFKHHRR